MELTELCKRLFTVAIDYGDPNFLGVQECENCTLNQVIEEYTEQMKMEGLNEQIQK